MHNDEVGGHPKSFLFDIYGMAGTHAPNKKITPPHIIPFI